MKLKTYLSEDNLSLSIIIKLSYLYIVYEIDMPWDNPNIIVDLPDGMYTVKTYHDQPDPIQEFLIGRP